MNVVDSGRIDAGSPRLPYFYTLNTPKRSVKEVKEHVPADLQEEVLQMKKTEAAEATDDWLLKMAKWQEEVYLKLLSKPELQRSTVLDKAKELINGQRATQYGDALNTHARIGRMWAALLDLVAENVDDPEDLETEIPASTVALMMICVKLIRAERNPEYEDSWVDIAGYAALGAEFARAK